MIIAVTSVAMNRKFLRNHTAVSILRILQPLFHVRSLKTSIFVRSIEQFVEEAILQLYIEETYARIEKKGIELCAGMCCCICRAHCVSVFSMIAIISIYDDHAA